MMAPTRRGPGLTSPDLNKNQAVAAGSRRILAEVAS